MSNVYDTITPAVYPNFRIGYPLLTEEVLRLGKLAAPRGLVTKELLGVNFVIKDSTDCLATGVGRKLNVKFAASDALMVIGGFSDHQWASRFNKRILHYGEHGAYGPRIAGQMQQVIDRLKDNHDTRRAVVRIWESEADLFYAEEKTDYPCTTQFQFMIRNNGLDIHVDMRANDVLLGTPHDVFAFSQLQCTVANVLGIKPGRYFHHVTSFHAYEKDWGRLHELHADFSPANKNRPRGLGAAGDSWSYIMELARRIAYNQAALVNPTDSELWYAQKLGGRNV